MTNAQSTEQPDREIAPELPLDVAAALLDSKWETPLNELRPKH